MHGWAQCLLPLKGCFKDICFQGNSTPPFIGVFIPQLTALWKMLWFCRKQRAIQTHMFLKRCEFKVILISRRGLDFIASVRRFRALTLNCIEFFPERETMRKKLHDTWKFSNNGKNRLLDGPFKCFCNNKTWKWDSPCYFFGFNIFFWAHSFHFEEVSKI